MSKRWFSSAYFRSAPANIDTEAGVIKGVKVCTAGEAKGHGVHLDADFIATVVEQGNQAKKGLKARFGHPNMCSESLGTFIGRFKNFSQGKVGTADCCLADLHLSESAQDTPNGDLYSYIVAMAENEADMFGTSIVFNPGKIYRRNQATGEKIYRYDEEGEYNPAFRKAEGPDFIECAKLLACDCVDDPAANEGLFSSFAGETIAGQITEFLDLHPQVFELLNDNPDVLEAIAQYGEKIDQFFTRYQAYRQNVNPEGKEAGMPNKEKINNVETEGLETAQPETETAEPGDGKEVVSSEFSTDSPEFKAAVKKELKLDRERQAEIRELGARFGFTKAAEEFANSDKSVEEFRKHILNKSPEDWRSSLAIKNPAHQTSEQEELDTSEGDDAVAKIKARRKAKFGSQ